MEVVGINVVFVIFYLVKVSYKVSLMGGIVKWYWEEVGKERGELLEVSCFLFWDF